LSVADTAAVCVLINSELLETTTVSSSEPTSSVSGIVTGWPGATLMLFTSAVLNPVKDAVTE
jgi:hypothetical protein